jgi:uncharacterized membrane protein
MQPDLVLVLCWTVFAAAHVCLGASPVRGRLVRQLGETGFTILFSSIAIALFALLIGYYAAHRFEGPAGLALGLIPAGRAVLIAAIVAGLALMAATFVTYDRSPYAVLGGGAFREPRGLERVTRHPFFVGLALFMGAHTLLATHRTGAVFAAGFVVLALGGAFMQDRKLLARHGERFARYLAATSVVPFAAILSGRQALRWRELPLKTLAAGALLAVPIRAVHNAIFAWGGAVFIGVVAAGSIIIMITSLRAARRRAAAVPRPTNVPLGGSRSWTA